MSLHTNALVLRSIGQFPALEPINLSTKLHPHQVLVEVYVSGICGKQLEEIYGLLGKDPFLPHLLGHEGFGKVVDVGNSVTNVTKGDHVIMHWISEFHVSHITPSIYHTYTNELINAGPITVFSQLSVLSCNRVTAVPSSTNPFVGSLLGCGLSTGLGAALNEAKITDSNKVLVLGCGGVGLSVIQGCRLASCNHIIACDITKESLNSALLCGAHDA